MGIPIPMLGSLSYLDKRRYLAGGQVDCAGNKEGNGHGNEGDREATAMVTKRAMATVTRVVGDKAGNGNSGTSNGNSNKGGR
jgi:hypothetical protein